MRFISLPHLLVGRADNGTTTVLGARGDPGGRLPRLAGGIVVHHVDLLEREVGGLVVEEEDDHDNEGVADGEDIAVVVADLVGDDGGEETDEEVEHPVTSGGNGGSGRTDAKRVHFTD